MAGEDHGYEKSAHLYDLFDTKENIPFFLQYGVEAGEILDIGAGTGRVAIPLAEAGVNVFCVEPSPAMRDVFEEKLLERGDLEKNITLIGGKARDFDFGRTFSAVYLSGTFDHFLDDSERLDSLRNIYNHLQSEGRLIFDVFVGLMHEKPVSPAGEVVDGDRVYRRSVGVKILSERKLEVQLLYEIRENRILKNRIEETSYVGVVNRREIHSLLKKTGFEVEEEFGNYHRDPFQGKDEILIIQAVKGT